MSIGSGQQARPLQDTIMEVLASGERMETTQIVAHVGEKHGMVFNALGALYAKRLIERELVKGTNQRIWVWWAV